MPTDFTPPMIAVTTFEAVIFFLGLSALWRFQFSPAARQHLRQAPALGSWGLSTTMFMQTVICVIGGAILVQAGLAFAVRRFFPAIANDLDWWTVVVGSGLHVGSLAGIILSRLLPDFFDPLPAPAPAPTFKPSPRLSSTKVLAAGIITFLGAMPLVELLAGGWQWLLELLHVPIEKQPLLDIFSKTHAPERIATMVLFTVVVAPLAEELIFRAGIFRFLRTRLNRWVALSISAFIFAAIHGNLLALPPLFVLGLVFALAYERTGRILVPVIAHGLFNLNTVVLLLMGVTV